MKSSMYGSLSAAILLLAISASSVRADCVTVNAAIGAYPYAIAINPLITRLSVPIYYNETVTATDGSTNVTATVVTESAPVAIAVNLITCKLSVASASSHNMTVMAEAPHCDTLVHCALTPSTEYLTTPARPLVPRECVNRWATK